MKVSIITVVYNNESTISDAIESVLSQQNIDLEYIVIDGASTDKTVAIIKSFKNHINVFTSEKDEGIYDAMNKGISASSGDIIGILNSDDLYADSQVINDVIMHFRNDSELDVLYGNLNYVKFRNVNKVIRKWISKSYYPSFFEDGNVPPHPTVFVKRQVYLKAGLFDLNYKLAADYEFLIRALKLHHFKSRHINRLMVKMRLGGATNRSFYNIFSANLEILQAWRKNGLPVPLKLMPLRLIKRISQYF